MVKKMLIPISLVVLLSIVFVGAVSFTASTFTNQYANDYGITKTGYKITYDIKEPGWYLLPNQQSIISISEDTGDYVSFYKSVDYKYAFSPFTKGYVLCERIPNANPLWCNPAEVYDESISYLESLSEEEFVRNYMIFTGFSADWHYYSKPVRVVYEYQPFMLSGLEGDDLGLMGAKLKEGWNLITYPAYLGFEDVELGDCSIDKAYLWIDETQEWFSIMGNLVDDDYSGGGVAIKVIDDCTLLKKKGGSISEPPPIPN